MHISIQRSKCIGSGNCVLAAPAFFSQSDDDGMIVVIDDDPAEAARAVVEQAADTCPAKVITIG